MFWIVTMTEFLTLVYFLSEMGFVYIFLQAIGILFKMGLMFTKLSEKPKDRDTVEATLVRRTSVVICNDTIMLAWSRLETTITGINVFDIFKRIQ